MTTCRCALLCISMPQSSLKAVKHAADTVMVLTNNCLRTNLQVCAALQQHATKLPQGCQALGNSKGVEKQLLAY